MAKNKDREARESSLASGWTIEGSDAESAHRSGGPVDADAEPGDHDSAPAPYESQLSAIALIGLGLIGGLYLFYTAVWFSWAQHYSTVNALVAEGSGALGGALQQVVFWAAPFAPALWFLSVLVLCRGSRTGKIVLWLLVGAVMLVPLPMFEGVLF